MNIRLPELPYKSGFGSLLSDKRRVQEQINFGIILYINDNLPNKICKLLIIFRIKSIIMLYKREIWR